MTYNTAAFYHRQPFILIGALLERDGKFLLLKENQGPDKGLWNIPSGKIELGESPLECAKREVKEEAGLEFSPQNIVAITSIIRRIDRQAQSQILRVIYSGGFSGSINFAGNEIDEVGDREIGEYRWVAPSDVTNSKLSLRHPDITLAIERHVSGQLLPLAILSHIDWIRQPTTH